MRFLCLLSVFFFLFFVFIFNQAVHASNILIDHGFIVHKVRKGDTLSKIAPSEHWDIIKRVNGVDEWHLVIGKSIYLPTDLNLAKTYCPVRQYEPALAKSERVVIFLLTDQYFGAYGFGELLHWGPISSGKKGRETPTGEFKVLWKSKDYVSKKYDSPMPFAVNFSNRGYFFHEQALNGKASSHGCLRLLRSDARKLYYWARKNDKIVIID